MKSPRLIDTAQAMYRDGRLDEAAAMCRKVLVSNKKDAVALHLLGVIRWKQGDSAEALDLLGRAARLEPRNFSLQRNLGLVAHERGEGERALQAFRRALDAGPRGPEDLASVGWALSQLGDPAAGERCLGAALASEPGRATWRNQLAWTLHRLGRDPEALAEIAKSDPGHPETHTVTAQILYQQGRFAEALPCFERARALAPSDRSAAWNCAGLYLLLGRWREGWEAYESRLRDDDPRRLKLPLPAWDGAPMPDGTLAVTHEQGFGDLLQFARFLPLIRPRVGRLMATCHPSLRRLMETVEGVDVVVSDAAEHPLALAADATVPLMSLPRLLGTTLETLPATVPYLQAPPEDVARWRDRIAGNTNLRVGLAWASSGSLKNDRRSLTLEALAPLLAVEGVHFYSLQPGARADGLVDHTADLRDFADTAALMTHLDLVISVDTAVAHLAGALGRPVWTLLPCTPEWREWRWLLDRDDSPWYPTMRLFRQDRPGEWNALIEQAAQALTPIRTPQEALA